MGENSESGAERSGAVGAGAGAGAGVDLARERGERIWRRFAPERARERLAAFDERRAHGTLSSSAVRPCPEVEIAGALGARQNSANCARSGCSK
jgi:hypothetical protein